MTSLRHVLAEPRRPSGTRSLETNFLMTRLTKERSRFFAPPEAASLLAKLRELLPHSGIDCYVVGGFVRDGLMGRTNNDIDIVVAGNATETASDVAGAFGARMVPLDEVNQVARVVLPRAEAHWHLDFATPRGSIEEDLGCRDFTINAIAVSLADIKPGWSQIRIIDPLSGVRDLRSRTVRAASEAAFQQDAARLLRAVRLAAVLDFSIDPGTEALVRRDASLVDTVAAERLRDELCQIFETGRAYPSVRHLARLGLLERLMPELAQAKGVAQPPEHFWDVFEHSLETVGALELLLRERDGEKAEDVLAPVPWTADLAQHFAEEVATGRTRRALLKLAGLLHDIGKPATRTVEQDGRMRFLEHARQGADMAAGLMERLRFSNREMKVVQLMIEHHMRPGYLAGEEMPSRRAIYRYFRDTAGEGLATLFLGLADHLAARGPTLDLAEWRRHAEIAEYILSKWFQEQAVVVPPKLIDGHTLMDRLGLSPGPQIGELLEMVREAQAAGELHTSDEALDFVAKRLGRN